MKNLFFLIIFILSSFVQPTAETEINGSISPFPYILREQAF